MFFKLFKVFLFRLVPRSNPFSEGTYRKWHESLKKDVVVYHKEQLRQLDLGFKMNEASHELIRRREIAREQGIGPLDPRYPDIFDVTGPL